MRLPFTLLQIDVSSMVSSQHGPNNGGILASASISSKPSTQRKNEDEGAAIMAEHCPFDTICIDAVRYAGLLSVFKCFLCESVLWTKLFF